MNPVNGEPLIILAARLSAGVVSSFLAIWIWSKTRDSAWLMMVLGTLFYFGETILRILEQVGITVFNLWQIG